MTPWVLARLQAPALVATPWGGSVACADPSRRLRFALVPNGLLDAVYAALKMVRVSTLRAMDGGQAGFAAFSQPTKKVSNDLPQRTTMQTMLSSRQAFDVVERG